MKTGTMSWLQITKDPRMRLEQRLRDAGLHDSEYARSILAQVKPLQAPRKDTVSTLRLDGGGKP